MSFCVFLFEFISIFKQVCDELAHLFVRMMMGCSGEVKDAGAALQSTEISC